MDNWSERGRPAVREALDHVWEVIDREVQHELARRAIDNNRTKQLLKSTVSSLESQQAENNKLRAENDLLRAQLATMSSSISPSDGTEDGSTTPTLSMATTVQNFPSSGAIKSPPSSSDSEGKELAKFKMRFSALSDNFKQAKEHLRKRRDERDLWMERAKKFENLARAAEEKHGIRILEESDGNKPDESRLANLNSSVPASTIAVMPPPAARTIPDSQSITDVEDAQLQSTQGDPDEAETEDLPPLPAPGDGQDSIKIKQEPSSDLPVVVSERSLKRRRVENDTRTTLTAPTIKAEPINSSPITASEHYKFDIQESIDLDDIAQKITTPRKRKDLNASAAEEKEKEEEDREDPRLAPHTTPKSGYVWADGLRSSAKTAFGPSVLTPISGNKRMSKNIIDEDGNFSAYGKPSLARGLTDLAEDGTPFGKRGPAKGSKTLPGVSLSTNGRLSSLLNTPASTSPIMRTPQTRSQGTASTEDTPISLMFPEPRALPFDKLMRQTKKCRSLKNVEFTTPVSKGNKKVPAQDESLSKEPTSGLRYKPLVELRLDDFKINPSTNNGQDYAYSEVVRDKDERAGLRGCTDMHCCGKHFRALALSHRPDPPLTAEQRQEEQRLLEKYLGEHAYRLATMTKAERDETWLKAKTEELSNKYGRHRHRFARMQSPPGFWNADFPDTQELEADREEAQKREKRAIAERYREAMPAIYPPLRTPLAVQVDAGAALGDIRNGTIPQAGRMSNRHLPAGQNIQAAAGGVNGGMDMNGNMNGNMAHMGNVGGGPRRNKPHYNGNNNNNNNNNNMAYHQHREHAHYQHPQHQQHPQHPQHMMYSNYPPYAQQQYYSMPQHQYQTPGVPGPGYNMPYQGYTRSPPPMQQFAPMVGVSIPPNYPRGVPQSPNPTTPYQPPHAPAYGLPHTPSSTHSTQLLPSHTPTTPQTPQSAQPASVVPTPPAQETAPSPAPAPASAPAPAPAIVAAAEPRKPFRPPLPWFSHADVPFPVRTSRTKRLRKPLVAGDKAVSLPAGQHDAAPSAQNESSTQASAPKQASEVSKTEETAKASTATNVPATRTVAPVIPVVPVLPKHGPKPETVVQEKANEDAAKPNHQDTVAAESNEVNSDGTNEAPAPAVKAPPTSWANLFAKASARAPANGSGVNGVNGDSADAANNFPGSAFSKSNINSLAEAIQSYAVENSGKLDFLEPRGLINTGNMCYMNSVLQVLMFCLPFYDLLDQVGKRAAHSFKSETPLIDALIMFMREYRVLKSSSSVEQLNRNLKSEDLERYGEPFTPEFVYDAIRQLSRFDSMRRGHQQDAEEFLGFLLQSLDDECTHVMKDLSILPEEVPSSNTSTGGSVAASDDWLEVGRKQRAAVSRLSGHNTSTPITKIFGGLLRSEFRVPGLKDSITTERYQPLQLDIQSPDVRNVVDALRGLTRPERIQGDFNSPRGKDVVATKQVFIESLPPVLILHLKRFQFDAEGHGTVKIWKKIGYPLELEIPREALSRQKRDSSMPRYKLISVVYHHGKNASGGHYTVDVRRQDGREWIRLDDTVIRRIRPEDVAESGSEEDQKDTRKETTSSVASNRFGAMNDEDTGDEDGWKQVTAPANGKRWSSVVNGAANGAAKEKPVKDSIKDNKVAYLLFYQRI
ncbi:hypothetical protein ACQKWADRAFT_318615 [Trichoderma austrokoningii]